MNTDPVPTPTPATPTPSWSWLLLHPVFWVSVTVLVVNDQLLKWSFPGLVTGKLSDVSGVVMVALVLVALSGRVRLSLVVTGVLFTLLKTVPLVALWAVPVLGGRTRTDPTDVVAVAALVPLGWWLWARRDRARARRGAGVHAWGTVAKIGGVFVAVLATSATSCDENTFESLAVEADGTIVASGVGQYATSARLELPVESNETTPAGDYLAWDYLSSDPVEDGSFETRACANDDVCAEIRDLSIVEISAAGDERVIVDYADVRDAVNSGGGICTVDLGPSLYDIVSNGDVIVVAMGPLGAMVRTSDGEWLPTGSSYRNPSRAQTAGTSRNLSRIAYVLPPLAALIGIVVLTIFPTRSGARATGIALAAGAALVSPVVIFLWTQLWSGGASALALSIFGSLCIVGGCLILAGTFREKPSFPARPTNNPQYPNYPHRR